VGEEVEEITGIRRREPGMPPRETPFALGCEVDVREELREVERGRRLADAVVRPLVDAHGDRASPGERAGDVAAVHFRVDESEAAHE
jgi:hypothetical protein